MASFDPGSPLGQDRAFLLLRDSAVTLFHKQAVLDETTQWLREQGYQVVEFDAASWSDVSGMHRDLAQALTFPDYYGHNLDAFNDCLRDVASLEYGWDQSATGLVLVFTGYDTFAADHRDVAQTVLQIMARNSRLAALYGGRMICLVQSSDPDLHVGAVGATPVSWNLAERFDSERR